MDLHAKGTPLHDATIVGDTVGDPYKDTSSVALNPVIKFTTLFGLLAVELAVSLGHQGFGVWTYVLAAVFFVAAAVFVWRSFYGMRITASMTDDPYAAQRSEQEQAEPRETRPTPPSPEELGLGAGSVTGEGEVR